MGQTVTAAVTVPRSASSSLRFLGLLKQLTDSDQNPNPSLTCPLELDERDDVFWSPSSSSPAAGGEPSASHLGRGGGGGGGGGGRPRPFVPEPRGLSAALGDDGGSGGAPVRRLAAARVTRPVPVPVPVAVGEGEGVLRLRLRQSAPVVVPAWPKRTRVRREKRERGEGEEEDEEDEEEGMVPPHVMVGRAHVMTFSVVEGAGRTLKGRDLRRVRNAVLERTGFLENLH